MQRPTILYIHRWPYTCATEPKHTHLPNPKKPREEKEQDNCLKCWESHRIWSCSPTQLLWIILEDCCFSLQLNNADRNGCKKRQTSSLKEMSPSHKKDQMTQAKWGQSFKSSTWEFLGKEAGIEHTSSRTAVCSHSPKVNSLDGELLTD